MRTGVVGDKGCDGWVAWTLRDEEYSYAPTIRWGSHGIFVGLGSEWNDTLSIIDPEMQGVPEIQLLRPTRQSFVVACVSLATQFDAPNLNWIRDAANTLYDNLT